MKKKYLLSFLLITKRKIYLMTILLIGINKIDINEKKKHFSIFYFILKSETLQIYEHLNDKQDTSTHQRKILRNLPALEPHPSPRV